MKYIILVMFFVASLFSKDIKFTKLDENNASQAKVISFLQTKVKNRWKRESIYKFNKYIYLYHELYSPAFQAGYYYVNLKTGVFKQIIGGHPESVQLLQGNKSFSLYIKGESSHRGMISVVYSENQCDYNDHCKEQNIYERWETLTGGCGKENKGMHMPIDVAKIVKKESLDNETLRLKVLEENCQTGKKKELTILHKFNKLL